MRTLFVVTFSIFILSVTGSASNQIKAPNAEQQESYNLDSKFFKKSLLVQNILIATSVKVSDTAILETGYLFNHMMASINDAVAERIRKRNVLCILVGKDELTSEIPQFEQ